MITSPSNGKVKTVVQLQQKAKARKEAGTFVTEGPRLFAEAPAERIREVYISESFSMSENSLAQELRAKWKRHPHEIVSDAVFARMSDTRTPQGILCLVEARRYELEELLKERGREAAGQSAPLLMVLEDLQDPGNLGTILRTGEGAGVTGIIMSRNTVDIYNPKTVRSTMGSIYRMPFYYSASLEETLAALKERGLRLYAAHLQGAVSYDVCSYTKGAAFLIGNEGNGLREETAALADERIRIPMLGQVESLNASMAAGVLMFEAARQRRSCLG